MVNGGGFVAAITDRHIGSGRGFVAAVIRILDPLVGRELPWLDLPLKSGHD
jgi:hypothetical protein